MIPVVLEDCFEFLGAEFLAELSPNKEQVSGKLPVLLLYILPVLFSLSLE